MINPVYYQTKTKMLSNNNAEAPRIEDKYGSLEDLLYKTLCTGFNEQPVSKVEILVDRVIISMDSVTHSYTVDQVVVLSGVLEEEYNQEYRLFETNPTYIVALFKDPQTPTTLTTSSSITVKTAPLGYTRIFTKSSTTGITSCFKNASKTSPAILKVIDDLPPNGYTNGWARYGRIVVGQDIDELGDFINDRKVPYHPDYPDAENTGNGVRGSGGIHGLAKWDYAPTSDSYNRENYTSRAGSFPKKWTIVGDANTFYLILDSHGDGYPTILGYGLFNAVNKNETFNIVLHAQDDFNTASATGYHQWFSRRLNAFGVLGDTTGNFLFCNAYGGGTTTISRYIVGGLFFGDNNRHLPHITDRVQNYNPQSGKVVTSRLLITDADTGVLRGYNRGIKTFYGESNITINRLTEDGDIILTVNEYSVTRRKVPYLFSLLDWEL